jgi:hypothetical protein
MYACIYIYIHMYKSYINYMYLYIYVYGYNIYISIYKPLQSLWLMKVTAPVLVRVYTYLGMFIKYSYQYILQNFLRNIPY